MSPRPKPRDTLARIVPYTPGRSIADVKAALGLEAVIKLASNENPFGSPISHDELIECLESIALYPDLSGAPLIGALAAELSVAPHQIIVGNGSDEILTMIGLAYLNPGDRVLTASGTFSEYGFVANLMDASVDAIPYSDFTFDLGRMADQITETTKLIFIANPNNPTGTIVSTRSLTEFMQRVPATTLVVIDEAYAEFVDSPHYPRPITWLSDYPNLIVTRTFSKVYGLAGFRIGYAVSTAEVIATLYKVRQPFNVNSVALAAASLALTKPEFIHHTIENNQTQKTRLTDAITEMGFSVIPSHANFICVHIGVHAKQCVDELMARGIIIRHLASFGMPEHVRITIGTPDQITTLITALTLLVEGKLI